jgi:hypothetical protein
MEIDNVSPAPEARPRPRVRRRAALGVAGVGAVLGLLGGATIASYAATPTPTPQGSQPAANSTFDPTKGGHVGANGVVEKLLTGTTADKVRAAALAAVPGATIERVENDAEGAVYEAHMVKSDGTHVTVKMDANFKVTGIETGPGPRPAA